jgi:hypothetical protein
MFRGLINDAISAAEWVVAKRSRWLSSLRWVLPQLAGVTLMG